MIISSTCLYARYYNVEQGQNEKEKKWPVSAERKSSSMHHCQFSVSWAGRPAGRQQQLEYKVHRKTSLTGQWRDSLELRESLAVITNFLDRLVVQSARPKKEEEEEERDEQKYGPSIRPLLEKKIIKKDGRRRQDGIE